MSTKELESKARELKELQRMAEELSAEMEALKDEIRNAMGEREEVTAGAYRILLCSCSSWLGSLAGFLLGSVPNSV